MVSISSDDFHVSCQQIQIASKITPTLPTHCPHNWHSNVCIICLNPVDSLDSQSNTKQKIAPMLK